MPSPFPGMDPFLEQPAYWFDFHATFINYWREAIADVLSSQYEATLGERVYLGGPRETFIEILYHPDRSRRRVDYQAPLPPHIPAADTQWVEQLLSGASE